MRARESCCCCCCFELAGGMRWRSFCARELLRAQRQADVSVLGAPARWRWTEVGPLYTSCYTSCYRSLSEDQLSSSHSLSTIPLQL